MTDRLPPQQNTPATARWRVYATAAGLAAVTAVLGGYLASLAIGFGWVIEQALRAGYLG